MRKFTILAVLFALVAVVTGCKKDNANPSEPSQPVKEPMTFYAYPQGGERTGLDTDGNTSIWTGGDVIKIFSSADTEGSLFTLTEGAGTNYGVFDGEIVKSSNYAAAYPASLASGQDGSIIIFDMQSSQNYVENTYAPNTVPVVSYTTTNKLEFVNTTGLLRIGIKTTEAVTVTKMVLTDNNSTAKLWGKFKVTATSDGELEYMEGGDNTLAINLGSGVALNSSTYTYFFFCLPAGTLAGGFTVDMESADGKLASIGYIGNEIITELNVGKPYDAEGVEFVVPRPACQKALDADANWVTIGTQQWLKVNTKCIEYDTESEAYEASWLTDNTIPTSSSSVNTPYYTDPTTVSKPNYMTEEQFGKLGMLYNWAAAVGVENGQSQTTAFSGKRQGICPNGSHVPSVAEWNTLRDELGGMSVAGKKMKTSTGWKSGTGEGDYGFAALPAGHADGSSVDDVGSNTVFWTATPYESDSDYACDRHLYYHKDYLNDNSDNKNHGQSVRCLRD